MTTRTPRGQKAVDAWPDRLAQTMSDPTDENLQSLCTLMDAIDAWVVQGWERRGHVERLDVLRRCRADAREANRAVTEALRASQAKSGTANLAKRRS